MALALAPPAGRPTVSAVLSSDLSDLSILLEADDAFTLQTRAFIPYGAAGPGYPGRVAVPNGTLAALLVGPCRLSSDPAVSYSAIRPCCLQGFTADLFAKIIHLYCQAGLLAQSFDDEPTFALALDRLEAQVRLEPTP